jgi:DNA-binding HxlR family transcriptional regulator
MKRTSLESARCPVARSLAAIGDWWSLLIIRDAIDGVSRFGDFQRSLGISKCTLTARLKTLVSLEILKMTPVGTDSAYEHYHLTDKGRDLFMVVLSLRQWGEDHCFRRGEKHSILVDSKTGRRIRKMKIVAQNGRSLEPWAVSVQKAGAR